MNIRNLVLVAVIVSILFAGCGKSEKQETAKNTKQEAVQTQAQQTAVQQPQFPKLEAAKVGKAIDALDDFTKLVRDFQKKPKPTTQEEMQAQTQEAMTEMNKMAAKYGFQNGDELGTYIGGIIQYTLIEQSKKAMDSQLASMPDDQKNSPQMQAQIQNFNSQYEAMKKSLGEDVIKIIDKNRDKIQKFLDEQNAIQQAQQQKMQQAQPKATMKMKIPKDEK
ncbi:hypothetical protein J7M00_01720 [bacterium]|nr:hypothetical protein [bacterium]